MKKVLILASVASMIDQFNMPNIHLLKELGYQVDVACNFEQGNTCSKERLDVFKQQLEQENIGIYQIDFTRNVFDLKQDYIAYKQLKKLLQNNCYEFLHCQSPIGGVVGRLAGRKCKVKVIYTAHGFHFYKGAPLLNWLVFYPIEKCLSAYTDMLITMNAEDYDLAVNKFHAKKTMRIHGVGINVSSYGKEHFDIAEVKEELGIPKDAKVMMSVGELNDNKNHATVIKALGIIKDSSYHYVICGKGENDGKLQELAKTVGLSERLHLMGFRTDIPRILSAADVYVFPSRREGLPVALMEAMATGLPGVVSDIRGNRDLVSEGENGYLVPSDSEEAYAVKIKEIMGDAELRNKLGAESRKKVVDFDRSKVCEEMKNIYLEVIKG